MDRKRKIGILTLPLDTNYGGILQAYALMEILKRMGHEVWLIKRRQPHVSFLRYCCILGKQVIKKYILKKEVSFILRGAKKKEREKVIRQHTQRFIEEYIQPQTGSYYSYGELKENIAKYNFDVYIVGSDQVWRPEYARRILYDFFFGFLNENNKEKKISYAASFGTENWEFSKKQTKICKKLLQQFDSVSVREYSGVRLCKEKFDVEALHMLDPTMLLRNSDYIKLIEYTDNKLLDKELLVYVLDNTQDKDVTIKKLEKEYGYKSFRVNTRTEDANKGAVPIQELIAPPVENWLKGFNDAKFVITDSFHACVFSIIFNKPFIVYANKNRGLSRFTSLLSTFNLEKRLIFSSGDLTEQILFNKIDWETINTLLEERREKSIDFLLNALR
jgi:hypothetical protein